MIGIRRIQPVLAAVTVLAVGLALAGCDSQQSGQPTATSSTPSTTGSAPGSPPGSPTGSPTGSPPGSVTSTGAPSVTTSPPNPNPAASSRCTAAVLRGTVQGGNPAAGNRYAKLVVTNIGRANCTLYGYGGFQLVDASGRALPTSTRRDEPPRPGLVRLAPGATAAKNLHWGVVPTGNEPVLGPCQPEPRSARIIPPDETQPFTVEWKFGPVCAGGTFHDSAYYKL